MPEMTALTTMAFPAAVLMSQPTENVAGFSPGPKAAWTLVGASAIPLWALWPLFAVISTGSMPVFQFLTIIYSVAALTLFALGSRRKVRPEAGARKQSRSFAWLQALMVSVGLLLSNIFFLLALRYMPAAPANLIVYLWPLMIVLIGAPLGLIAFRRRHLLSIALGLAGAALVIGPGMVGGLAGGSWTGIGLAAASGLAWAIFCVFRLWQGADAPEALTGGLALSAVIGAVVHLATEATVAPSSAALVSALLNGMVPLALGNLAWDHGIRRGDRALLTVSVYATPLVSALILIVFGYAEATTGLLAGGLLIAAGSIISAR